LPEQTIAADAPTLDSASNPAPNAVPSKLLLRDVMLFSPF
jgi:hypothetical protein